MELDSRTRSQCLGVLQQCRRGRIVSQRKITGEKAKQNDDLHISWRVKFEPGTIKAISRKNGKVVLEKEIHTAGKASKISLNADKTTIKNDTYDLVYVTFHYR